MKLKLPQSHIWPQQFYIKLIDNADGTPSAECINMNEEEALAVTLYHMAIDRLCAENGFLYMTIEDGSCPKYLHSDGQYKYRAHNYFIDEGLIYHCVASLNTNEPGNFQLELEYYYGEHPIKGKTRRINIIEFVLNNKDQKVQIAEKLLDHVSYVFADGIMHVAAEAVMWGSWGYDADRSTAFPQHMQYNRALLEQVVIPEYVLAPLKIEYQDITKAAVTAYSGLGRDASIDVEFLVDGKLKKGTVSLYIYTQCLHKAAVGGYSKEVNKSIFKRETQPMASWQVLYG